MAMIEISRYGCQATEVATCARSPPGDTYNFEPGLKLPARPILTPSSLKLAQGRKFCASKNGLGKKQSKAIKQAMGWKRRSRIIRSLLEVLSVRTPRS